VGIRFDQLGNIREGEFKDGKEEGT